MGGKSKAVTVGYKHNVGLHAIYCHGPIDKFTRLSCDERIAWQGETGAGTIYVNAPDLFGGEAREGGIGGYVDVEMGGLAQTKNAYLLSKIGPAIPAYRGVAGMVFKDFYWGNNPYLKAISVRGQRIHTAQDGGVQWYDAKAAVANTAERVPVPGERGWSNRGTGQFIIGASNELSGSLTFYQGWWHGNIDSFRVTKGIARYANKKTYPVPTAAFPTGLGDIHWANVVLLMDMEGPNNSTAFSDAKGHVVSAHNGAKITTARSKFGASSAVFDGVNDYLTVAMGGDQALGEVWTMEAWVWQESELFGITYCRSLFGYGDVNTAGADTVWYMTGHNWVFVDTIANNNPPFHGAYQNAAPFGALGRWAFVSICYDGNAFWLHQDGKLLTITGETGDMNPAHIIRESLTNEDWGMGYSPDDIDDASFEEAADTLYDEGLGVSLLWDKQTKIEDFINEVVRHIDAALFVSRTTGKFKIKLIRADYDPASIPLFDESNIEKITNPKRSAFGELVTSVTVNFWRNETGKNDSVTVHDPAMVQQQGQVIGTTLQYPGFTNLRNAQLAASRDLRALSNPFLACEVYSGEDARELEPGDVFRLTWGKWKLDEVVMRVTGYALSEGKSTQVRLTCVEDVFDTPLNSFYAPPGEEWVDPSQPPGPVEFQISGESPYYEIVQVKGQTTADNDLLTNNDLGYVFAAARRPINAINAKLWTDAGGGYEEADTMDFAPSGRLVGALTKSAGTMTLTDMSDLDLIVIGSHCQIGDGETLELARVDAVDIVTGIITIGRGVLDTVPHRHDAGTLVLFWDLFAGGDPTEYAAGETVDLRITPISGAGQVELANAGEMSVTLNQRAFRPYAPGNLTINGDSYVDTSYSGTLTVEWAHRDRTQQTSGELADHFDGNIGPEAGTLYRIEVYIDGVLDDTLDDLPGTSEPVDPSADGLVRIEVSSKRDGLYSMQAASHEFLYIGSGSGRAIEDGNAYRYTEDGSIRITED